MPLLLLIRHGENDYKKRGRLAGRIPNVHLNEKGREQARQLGEALKDVPVTSIYSSPLERALETAAPIAAVHGLDIQTKLGLIETDIGEWQGRSHNALRLTKVWKAVQYAPSRFQFPGGETFHGCQSRIVTQLDDILHRHKSKDILVCVFHADPIKLAVAHYLGLPLDNFQRLGCDTGSVAMLHIHESGASLLKLNQLPPFSFPQLMKEK